MADDLNEFLRQAALRREARKRAEAQGAGKASKAASPPPVTTRTLANDPPTSDRPALSSHPKAGESGIEKADRQREAHRQEVFGEHPKPLQRTPPLQPPKPKNKQPPPNKPTPKNQPKPPSSGANRPAAQASTTAAGSASGFEPVSSTKPTEQVDSNEMLKMLRNPQTLKTAFIVSEIFARKFD